MTRSFTEELKWRGLIQDMTPGLEEKLSQGMVIGYIGFDPTAPSLTIGNYVQVMLLKFFQLAGHKPIVLMGGATGRIGDPSGKDTERELKSFEELDQNLAHQVRQFEKLLDVSKKDNGAMILNNHDFYKNMNVLDFLRDVGKNLTINYMLSKESVRRRMDTGMSYTEFSYQVLQAYDFLCLFRERNCVLQMGGSDQWGNITAGTEFIRKNIPNAEAYALTSPLLTKSDGKKFGKSEEGNIWLDPNLTSPYQFYQFWINVDDKDLPKLYRYFSLKSKEEIESLESTFAQEPVMLKEKLALELTERIHGDRAAQSAKNVSSILFNPKATAEELYALQDDDLNMIMQEIPSFTLNKNEVKNQIMLIDLLGEKTEICSSKSEARRAIQSNAVSVNKKKTLSIEERITSDMLLHHQYLMIENGKKNKYFLKFN